MILWKFMCESFGVKSEREAIEYIEAGKVKVSGCTCTFAGIADLELSSGTKVEFTIARRAP